MPRCFYSNFGLLLRFSQFCLAEAVSGLSQSCLVPDAESPPTTQRTFLSDRPHACGQSCGLGPAVYSTPLHPINRTCTNSASAFLGKLISPVKTLTSPFFLSRLPRCGKPRSGGLGSTKGGSGDFVAICYIGARHAARKLAWGIHVQKLQEPTDDYANGRGIIIGLEYTIVSRGGRK